MNKSPSRTKRTPAPSPSGVESYVPGLKRRYNEVMAPALMKECGYANRFQVPRVTKVVINVGLGEAIQNIKVLDAAVKELALMTGQRPVTTKAKRSIAAFKLREGMPIGCKVTLRGNRMYDFLERLLHVALPRIRDFRGVPLKAFDGRGNYTLGLKEQLIFPELHYDDIVMTHGMDITIATTARTNEEGRALLKHLGMPFRTS